MKFLDGFEGGISQFSTAYTDYGVLPQPDNSILCREWAPNAEAIYIRGDFSK